jgi:hypothetical protein
MASHIQLLDVVALTSDIPKKSLLRGQVGTVVDILGPGRYEVEFCDDGGHTYAQTALGDNQLLVLRYRPEQAA